MKPYSYEIDFLLPWVPDSLYYKKATVTIEVEDAVKTVRKEYFPHVVELNTEHLTKLKALFVERRDTFAILPTGIGKSLIFQAVPLIAKKLGLVVKCSK